MDDQTRINILRKLKHEYSRLPSSYGGLAVRCIDDKIGDAQRFQRLLSGLNELLVHDDMSNRSTGHD